MCMEMRSEDQHIVRGRNGTPIKAAHLRTSNEIVAFYRAALETI